MIWSSLEQGLALKDKVLQKLGLQCGSHSIKITLTTLLALKTKGIELLSSSHLAQALRHSH